MNGEILPINKSIRKTIVDFLNKTLEEEIFDAILIPVKVPAGDSFAWLLIQDKSLLENAFPLPPIMPVQGAKALSSLTRLGKGNKKIAAVMRPCEIRASIELSKFKQVELENIFLISIDCPGALPLSDYLKKPKESEEIFEEAIQKWESEFVKPVCKICDNFSLTSSDLHFGILGAKNGNIFLIPNSPKGKSILNKLDISAEESISEWENRIKTLTNDRKEKKAQIHKQLKSQIGGVDNLLETFSKCINCHNCMSVCPICYCRQCYFDSEALRLPPENYLLRAETKGSLRFPSDTILFHLGRMSHMSLSCVACGTCEDACPMSIPVAQIFSLVADSNQNMFDYVPGKNIEESLPLVAYKEEEFQEMVKPYFETYQKK